MEKVRPVRAQTRVFGCTRGECRQGLGRRSCPGWAKIVRSVKSHRPRQRDCGLTFYLRDLFGFQRCCDSSRGAVGEVGPVSRTGPFFRMHACWEPPGVGRRSCPGQVVHFRRGASLGGIARKPAPEAEVVFGAFLRFEKGFLKRSKV